MTQFMQLISRSALQTCKQKGWAALESGISWPVPVFYEGKPVQLGYFLYWSQLRGRQQVIHEPFAQIMVSYPDGQVQAHHTLQTHTPILELGTFPYPEIAHLSGEERRKLWSDLFEGYPGVIAAYAGWPAAASPDELQSFRQNLALCIPSYLIANYHGLNPAFFAWLESLAR